MGQGNTAVSLLIPLGKPSRQHLRRSSRVGLFMLSFRQASSN